MKLWMMNLVMLLAIGSMAGCKQKLYMTQGDFNSLKGLPLNIENDPNVTIPQRDKPIATPPSVNDPDRPPYYLTLAEAISIALETGNRGTTLQSTIFFGQRNNFIITDDLVSFSRPGVANDDAIRAFALDPAIVGSDIEGALAKFDTRFITTMNWQKVDNAVANALFNFQNGDTAAFSSGFYKPLPTGGLANITVNSNYLKLANPPAGFQVVNPAYTPNVSVGFEQPLLQSFGIFMNQLLPAHPGSIQIPNLKPSGGRSEGILVTRIRFEQQKNDFERDVNVLLFNLESAYWALYASYFQLYAAEQGLRQSFITWRLTNSEQEAGKKTPHEVAQVRAQFENFRALRINALQTVMESERQLRGVLGIAVADGYRIVPADAPNLSPFLPDYESARWETKENRPELRMMRQDLRAQQMNILLQKNGLLPDFRFVSSYNVNSIGTSLDGTGNNALMNLADNKYNSWLLGFRFDMPLGFRDASASLRAAQLNLARSFISLNNQEIKAERFLYGMWQNLSRYYERIKATRGRREALATQLRGLYARINAGKDSLIVVLQAQADFAQALQDEHDAIANYNIVVAGFHYAKGTIMDYENVRIADGALPNCVLARAKEHFRKKSEGIVARERQEIPNANSPINLPSLLAHQPKTPDLPEALNSSTPWNYSVTTPGSPMQPGMPPATITADPASSSNGLNSTPGGLPPQQPQTPLPTTPSMLPEFNPAGQKR